MTLPYLNIRYEFLVREMFFSLSNFNRSLLPSNIFIEDTFLFFALDRKKKQKKENIMDSKHLPIGKDKCINSTKNESKCMQYDFVFIVFYF